MTRALAALLSAAALGPPGAAAGPAPLQELTPELIFGGTLEVETPSGFLWSPDASRLAFVQRESPDGPERPHLLDMRSRDRARMPIPDGVKDDQDVALLGWSPDHASLLGEIAGDLYLLPAAGQASAGPPRRLTSTAGREQDAKLSPDGSRVGFVRDHELYVIDLATGAERALTAVGLEGVLNGEPDWVYEEEFSLTSGWWWSPDSSRIAYLQLDERHVPSHPIVDFLPVHPQVTWQRYPKAGDANARPRLGVVEASGPPGGPAPLSRWMDLGPASDVYLPRAAWTASGSRLAVQRLDRLQTALDLLLCDPRDGSCASVVKERDERWVNVDDAWRFVGPGAPGAGEPALLWGSERDGFRHLYLIGEDGRMLRRLTEGPWVVTALSEVDAKRGWVYFEATERSPAQRHLYRVRLDGSGFARLTQEEGWHETWPAPDGSAFVDVHSTAASPPRAIVRRRDGTSVATLDEGREDDLRKYRRGRVDFLTVTAADGTPLPAMMTRPPDFDPSRRYPVLVYVYGGPHAQVVRDAWWGGRGLWHQMMAARGYIVWSLDNRGSGGRGHDWETPIHRDMGRREMTDQLDGVSYLRSLPYVDPERIGIWGWSYGGYMTLYCLTGSPAAFRAGAAVAPVVDWKDYDTIYTERYMRRPADNPAGYESSAPLKAASSLAAPLLLAHGTADDNVHLHNSAQMLHALVQAGRPVEFLLYPGQGHGITDKKSRVHLYEALTRFFDRHLAAGGSGP